MSSRTPTGARIAAVEYSFRGATHDTQASWADFDGDPPGGSVNAENKSDTAIRTPDQRLRAFVSSTLGELAAERAAVARAIAALGLTPVMFELGARPHPPRELYR